MSKNAWKKSGAFKSWILSAVGWMKLLRQCAKGPIRTTTDLSASNMNTDLEKAAVERHMNILLLEIAAYGVVFFCALVTLSFVPQQYYMATIFCSCVMGLMGGVGIHAGHELYRANKRLHAISRNHHIYD